MTDTAIQARGLSRRFGRLIAVNNVDLDVPTGQIYGFLGPNGSGKTTLIRTLCGLLTPSAGEISALGLKIPAEAEALRRRLGYMTQKFSLYEDLTVTENMQFMARIHGLGKREAQTRIELLLERYALSSMRRRTPGAMSGGQRQRLALAVATLHSPTLLMLDEPTSAVDPENRRDFWEKLFDLSDKGTTVLVSTHYMDEAERCHQLAILDNGFLRKQGTPRALMGELDSRVVELSGPDLSRAKEAVLALPQVQSAAQQGLQLRVLVRAGVDDPVRLLNERLASHGLTITAVKPSLEDVFVAATADLKQP